MFYVEYLVVLDTNIWYHKTNVVSEEISITIGSEYDWDIGQNTIYISFLI